MLSSVKDLLDRALAGDRHVARAVGPERGGPERGGPGGGGPVSGRELRARALAVARVLGPAAEGDERPTAFAFGRDRVAFAAALLGSWASGRGVALPADARRELVAPVALDPESGELLHDTGVGRGVLAAGLAPVAGPLDLALVARAGGRALLSAVGYCACATARGRALAPPAGRPELCARGWTAEELAGEVAELARELALGADDAVVATVAPSSLPGALLGVLVPLVSGAPFSAAVPRGAEEVARAARDAGATVLVSAPAHLARLLELPRGALGGLTRVVSTWAALDPGLADELARRHGVAVRELLGPEVERGAAAPLRALQTALSELAGVEDAAVAAGPRGPLAVVQAPGLDSAAALRALAGRGTPLAGLRVVERLERDPNGGLPAEVVLRSFGLDRAGRPLALDFEWGAAEGRRLRVRVPPESAWFQGHFPGYPVLAGAVQLQELVLPALRRLCPGAPPVRAWSGLKFLARIRPGDELAVEVEPGANGAAADFAVLRGGERCTAGRATFAAAGART